MDTSVADDGLDVQFTLAGFTLEVGDNAPLAGAVGLAGELSADIPEKFDLRGFRLAVNCIVDKSFDAAALLTCSIGTATYTREWPRRETLELSSRRSSRTEKRRPDRKGEALGDFLDDFTAICFMEDGNPANLGDPRAHPPLAPFPITLGMQARCQTADQFVFMQVSSIDVALTRSS